jgi:hypothetical protein
MFEVGCSVLQELKEEKDEVEKNIENIADGIAGEL